MAFGFIYQRQIAQAAATVDDDDGWKKHSSVCGPRLRRDLCEMRSVPPRGSGWSDSSERSPGSSRIHPVPRGGTDFLTREILFSATSPVVWPRHGLTLVFIVDGANAAAETRVTTTDGWRLERRADNLYFASHCRHHRSQRSHRS